MHRIALGLYAIVVVTGCASGVSDQGNPPPWSADAASGPLGAEAGGGPQSGGGRDTGVTISNGNSGTGYDSSAGDDAAGPGSAPTTDAAGGESGSVTGGGQPGGDSGAPPGTVGPVIPADCPGDPTQGFTEYMDTFVVQHPYDLMVSDRFQFVNGIYTTWVLPTDKPHVVGNTTAPRTEMRWSNFTTGEHLMNEDVMYESPLDHTCITQIHNVVGAIAVYLRVDAGNLHELNNAQPFLNGYFNKWFNLKVAFDPQALQVRVWVNNCLKISPKSPAGPTPDWYFKNGTYTCTSSICRANFKNIRFYRK
jgi:hypothetical protein